MTSDENYFLGLRFVEFAGLPVQCFHVSVILCFLNLNFSGWWFYKVFGHCNQLQMLLVIMEKISEF